VKPVMDDLGCEAAAAELMGRRPGAVDPMIIACAKSLLETQKALVALLPQVVDRFVDKPRRKRTFRLVRHTDGGLTTEEVEAPAPAGQNSAERRSRSRRPCQSRCPAVSPISSVRSRGDYDRR
jgi:hypothetical protein